MNRLDLIIDALELARNEIHDPTLWTDKADQALAAARELKALKPVGEIVCEDLGKPFHARKIRMHFYDFVPLIGTKLYGLDEVTK